MGAESIARRQPQERKQTKKHIPAGFHQRSRRKQLLATVRLRPTPPARRETRRRVVVGTVLNCCRISSRLACGTVPSSRRKVKPWMTRGSSRRSSIEVHCEKMTDLEAASRCRSSFRAFKRAMTFVDGGYDLTSFPFDPEDPASSCLRTRRSRSRREPVRHTGHSVSPCCFLIYSIMQS